MFIIRRKFIAQIAILGGLAVLAAPSVRGGSIGHHENPRLNAQDGALPSLHEHTPTNVPSLSNQALVNLWEHHQFSPILRNSSIEQQLYSAVTAQHDLNPTQFDHLHPTVGRLIEDPAYLNKLLAAYIAHPASFTHDHHQLVPILRGYGMTPPPTSTSTSTPPATSEVGGISVQENTGPPGTPPTTGAQELVPEPSSLVLMFLGMSLLASRIRLKRAPVASRVGLDS
jgi:hypothetical protein